MQRLAVSVVALAALILGPISPVALAASNSPTIDTSAVSFDMSSATCPNLPPGTSLHGDGTQVSITTVTIDARGVKTIRNATTTTGHATDQMKRTYIFEYANEFRITNSLHSPDKFTGKMTDLFVLAGNGPAHLDNGFVARLTVNEAVTEVFAWHSHHAFGDPIGFGTGKFVAHCDPL